MEKHHVPDWMLAGCGSPGACGSPVWDCDHWLSVSPNRASWPEAVVLRPFSRLPAYVLDRGPLAPLGFEGDLHLGWQAGDAIAEDLG